MNLLSKRSKGLWVILKEVNPPPIRMGFSFHVHISMLLCPLDVTALRQPSVCNHCKHCFDLFRRLLLTSCFTFRVIGNGSGLVRGVFIFSKCNTCPWRIRERDFKRFPLSEVEANMAGEEEVFEVHV
jgi:hypothetical protein